ncbi:MAG TPA: hypothetical protein VMU99_01290 [Acidimicrobiales bacterium]|nr:hypothetical protein [Acidimicrobiales bacterium]
MRSARTRSSWVRSRSDWGYCAKEADKTIAPSFRVTPWAQIRTTSPMLEMETQQTSRRSANVQSVPKQL